MEVERKDHKKKIKIDEKKCEQIYKILMSHKGKDNAVSSKSISAELGFSMEDTQVYCRTYIAKTMEKYRIPVISCSKGYFVASDKNEMMCYLDSMDNRIRGIEQTKDKVWQYFCESRNSL